MSEPDGNDARAARLLGQQDGDAAERQLAAVRGAGYAVRALREQLDGQLDDLADTVIFTAGEISAVAAAIDRLTAQLAAPQHWWRRLGRAVPEAGRVAITAADLAIMRQALADAASGRTFGAGPSLDRDQELAARYDALLARLPGGDAR